MSNFNFAEYVVGGLTHRNKVSSVFAFNGERQGCYRSLFTFDEGLKAHVEKTGSVSGYVGPHTSAALAWDFDGDDLELVRQEVVKFCLMLEAIMEIRLDAMHIAFSGSKGFHVLIPMAVIGDVQPSEDFSAIYRGVCLELAEGFPLADSSIYEVRRIFRLLHSIHEKSGLYKIPLTFDELMGNDSDKIRELAKTDRQAEYLPISEISVMPQMRALWDNHQNKCRSIEKVNAPSTNLFAGMNKGSRNSRAIQLAGLFMAKGFDESATNELMALWNTRNSPPMDEDELRHLVEGAFLRYQETRVKDAVIDMPLALVEYKKYIASLKTRKIKTGFDFLDEKMRGIIPGETCCVIGKTSVGKSAFLQNIGMYHALHAKTPALFFSLEMPIVAVFERAMQYDSGMPGTQIEDAFIHGYPEIYQQADDTVRTFGDFYTVTRGGLNLAAITAICQEAESTIGRKIGLVLVDYLGLVNEKGKDLYEQVSRVARGLKETAKQLDVPIIFLSQVTKQFQPTTELELGAARDSGSIDEAADFVVGLWRDAGGVETDDDVPMKCAILKNRKGGLGSMSITMNKRSLRFTANG
jgi:KaiC/GvpD/RAD55 family RecA-like ATPase